MAIFYLPRNAFFFAARVVRLYRQVSNFNIVTELAGH